VYRKEHTSGLADGNVADWFRVLENLLEYVSAYQWRGRQVRIRFTAAISNSRYDRECDCQNQQEY
jgi:hypothetical protein